MARIQKITLQTTHVDKHGEVFPLDVLQTMMKLANEAIIPMGVEHDPRIPPLGRMLHTAVEKLEDGEYALIGTAELFDGDITNLSDTGDRVMVVRDVEGNSLELTYDRNFRGEEDQETMRQLALVLKCAEQPDEEIKKSIEPIAILTIAGKFALAGIAAGFFGEIGADAYRELKKLLVKIFSTPNPDGAERLFTFNMTIVEGTHSVNVEVILANPTDTEIQEFMDDGIKKLDQVLPAHFNSPRGFRRIVFDYDASGLRVKFGVLKNGVPVKLN